MSASRARSRSDILRDRGQIPSRGQYQQESSVVSRLRWDAAPPRDHYVPRGPLRSIVLHHTSWPSRHLAEVGVAEEASYMRAVQSSHTARNFIDIGYHYVIMPSGRVFAGRPVWAMGAHVKGHNVGTVGISLAGDFDIEEPTRPSLISLDALTDKLTRHSAGSRLVGHRDLATTTCPGERIYMKVLAARAAEDVTDLGPTALLPPEVARRATS